jgi:hypothetical protein
LPGTGILRVKSGLDFSSQLNAEETLAAEAEDGELGGGGLIDL